MVGDKNVVVEFEPEEKWEELGDLAAIEIQLVTEIQICDLAARSSENETSLVSLISLATSRVRKSTDVFPGYHP